MSAQVEQAPHAVTPAAGGIAERDGVWLAWRQYGDAAGPSVLMIMGFMGSGRAWFRVTPPLAAAGYRPVVFDNRGTGDSDRPRGLWTMDELAADALAVMDAAGLEDAHVVGASMGGMIAQHLALAAPERVRSLTLCCTHAGGKMDRPSWRMAASLALRPLLGPARTFPIVAPLLYSERTRRNGADLLKEDLRLRFEDSTPVGTAAGQVAAISGHDTRERLGSLSMPVLVVHGEEDRLVPASAGVDLAERIPGARLVLIPQCGHILTTDAQAETISALLGFLAECEA